jgi:hypothetical protein
MNPKTRKILAAALAAGAAISYFLNSGSQTPTPAPMPESDVNLRGRFIGPTAAADAATLAALTDELGAVVEYDGMQPEPRLRTGAALDDLRICAREIRLRGDSLGARQPKVKAEIDRYMTAALGTDGGPISPEQRAQWVAAFRTIARAAADAAR